MSVVLRCPTCGTTQGDAGECEACSEGEVRYFCTNHDGRRVAQRSSVRQLRREVRRSARGQAAHAADIERADPTCRGPGLPSAVPPACGRAFVGTGFRETAAEARRTRGTGRARGAAADAVARGVARGNHRGARARPGALRGRHTVGEAAGGGSSARVPPCRLSRPNCGPRVPADRRCDHLLISIVRRLHRQLSSVCGHAGPEVASVPAEVIHGGARQGVGYWRLLRDQGS